MAAFCIAACSGRYEIPEPPGGPLKKEVNIVISGGSLPAVDTRSSVTAAEDGIRSATVLFFKDGVLQEQLGKQVSFSGRGVSSCTITMELVAGCSYDILAIANANPGNVPARLSEALAGLACCVSDIKSWSSDGLPMAGRAVCRVPASGSSVEIPLVRLVSKVNFTVKTSGIKHGTLKLTSIRVRQMNSVCPFFAPGRAAAQVCDGDLASAAELSGANASPGGYTCSFYVLENLQGNILAGNSDPRAKVPDRVRAAGHNPDLCTYLELLGTYSGSSGQLRGEPLTARLFLGSDASSNFDLLRNSQYNIELSITDEGCLGTDWKIDGNLLDSREMYFSPATSSLQPGSSGGARLVTNLSYAAGDYSYSVGGDLMYFDVQAADGARQFTVTCLPGAPAGAHVEITASTWDGRVTAVHRASAAAAQSAEYTAVWQEGGSVLYLAQRGILYIKDASTGNIPGGKLTASSTTGVTDITKSGSGWLVDAVQTGEDTIVIKADGEVIARIPFSCVAPVLKFSSDRIFLPLDGNVVTCGPSYRKVDGSVLNYSDFVPELYEELLDVSVERDVSVQKFGRSWQRGSGYGNPAVRSRMMASTHSVFGFYLDKLEVGGVAISDNYDFSAGPVTLERVTGYPNDRDCGVEPATAELYTSDPFSGSAYLGERSSWALARWNYLSDRNETFTFTFGDLVLPGNDASAATVVYPFSGEGKYEFTKTDRNTVKMTILYNDFVETAMPEHDFALAPVMRNRNSGHTYISHNRLSAVFTVNLAVGGEIEENGAGGSDVRVEWAFPRRDEGRLSYIEKNAVAAYSDAGRWNKGMYERLYIVHGYTPDYVRETESPAYSFADLSVAHSVISPLSGSSYHVPEEYGGGYDLVLWKYEELYPDTGGWLPK